MVRDMSPPRISASQDFRGCTPNYFSMPTPSNSPKCHPNSVNSFFHSCLFWYLQPEVFSDSENPGWIQRNTTSINGRDQLLGSSDFGWQVVMWLKPIQDTRDEGIHNWLVLRQLQLYLWFSARCCWGNIASYPTDCSFDLFALHKQNRATHNDLSFCGHLWQLKANSCELDACSFSNFGIESLTMFFQKL